MSVETTIAKLAARIRDIESPRAAKVYEGPREAVDIGSFPCVLVSLDPDVPHRWSMAASGLARHDYTAAIWIFVGPRSNGPTLPELHARCLPWIEPLARALYSGITLEGTVEWVGDGGDGTLHTYTIGPHEWAGKEFFGLKIPLPCTEKIPMPMDA